MTTEQKTTGVTTAADPLTAIPVIEEGIEARLDPTAKLQLKKLTPANTSAWISRMFGRATPDRVNLDEQGTHYWELVDGRRNLHQIAQSLAVKFGISDADARRATVLYTRMLILRKLVRLK